MFKFSYDYLQVTPEEVAQCVEEYGSVTKTLNYNENGSVVISLSKKDLNETTYFTLYTLERVGDVNVSSAGGISLDATAIEAAKIFLEKVDEMRKTYLNYL